MPKRSHEKRLEKLAARRAAQRRRKQRQRTTLITAVVVLVVVGLGFGGYSVYKSKTNTEAAAKPTPSASPSAAAVACGGSVPADASINKPMAKEPPKMTIDPNKTYTAVVDTSCGEFKIQLDPKLAPNTVNSIVHLADEGFYNGLTFHRIAKGFVIQGGDPKGNGTGGPGYTTVDKPPKDAKYPIGTVAMAKTGSEPPGTAGSQFFIVTSNSAQAALAPKGQGGLYAIVGHVVSGMDVVNRIAALPIQGGGTDGAPAQKVYMMTFAIKVS